MLIGADLYPCNRHTLSPPPRHLASGANDVSGTIRPLMLILAQRVVHINRSIRHYPPANVDFLLNELTKFEKGRMFSQPLSLRFKRPEDSPLVDATYEAALSRWPKVAFILRQGARVIHYSRKPRLVK